MALIFDGTNGFRDTGTGALGLPFGTTAQRPANPANGYIRYNTTLNLIESYVNGQWNTGPFNTTTYDAEVLVVAGGGGSNGQAGAGAGGLLYNFTNVMNAGTTYPVIIGAGGSSGVNGSNTSFLSFNAVGGGAPWTTGGSGGGSTWSGDGVWGPYYAGTLGQGNRGGRGYYSSSGGDWFGSAGGGGGAGQVGGDGTSGHDGSSGKGGDGIQYSTSGTATYYAGGGGGGGNRRNYGNSGGLGGGGSGAPNQGGTGSNGTVNSGGGGGGGTAGGGAGGSGIVIIRYAGTPRATGGTITQAGGNTIHTFTTSGNFVA